MNKNNSSLIDFPAAQPKTKKYSSSNLNFIRLILYNLESL